MGSITEDAEGVKGTPSASARGRSGECSVGDHGGGSHFLQHGVGGQGGMQIGVDCGEKEQLTPCKHLRLHGGGGHFQLTDQEEKDHKM